MNMNLHGGFQICISVPLMASPKNHLLYVIDIFCYQESFNELKHDASCYISEKLPYFHLSGLRNKSLKESNK